MTGALTRHDCQQKRQVGRSIAVRAQRLGILPKHSFPRQLFSLWLISCQILALVGLLFANRAAHGQDPHLPGDPLGTFHVTAHLQSDGCQAAFLGVTDPWQFEVELSRKTNVLYWLNGSEAIPGDIAGDDCRVMRCGGFLRTARLTNISRVVSFNRERK